MKKLLDTGQCRGTRSLLILVWSLNVIDVIICKTWVCLNCSLLPHILESDSAPPPLPRSSRTFTTNSLTMEGMESGCMLFQSHLNKSFSYNRCRLIPGAGGASLLMSIYSLISINRLILINFLRHAHDFEIVCLGFIERFTGHEIITHRK